MPHNRSHSHHSRLLFLRLLLLLFHSQLHIWGSPFFFFCVLSYISGVHHSSSFAFQAISLGFTILLLLLRPQLYIWGSPFFFFCVPSYISGVHHSSSSSASPAIYLGFTILLLLRSKLYLWGSTTFLLLRSKLYLRDSPFFFFCVPTYISGVHHSSSFAFPAISLGFTILLLRSQLNYISGVHFFGGDFCVCDLFLNPTTVVVTFRVRGWCMLCVLFCCRHLPV